MSLFSLKGKTALITGGASGIGKAIAKKFAGQGAEVHILEFNGENGRKTQEEIEAAGGRAYLHVCDVSDQQQVKQVIGEIAEGSQIDILVNNAGIAHVGNIEGTEEEDMDRLFQVNIKGVYN